MTTTKMMSSKVEELELYILELIEEQKRLNDEVRTLHQKMVTMQDGWTAADGGFTPYYQLTEDRLLNILNYIAVNWRGTHPQQDRIVQECLTRWGDKRITYDAALKAGCCVAGIHEWITQNCKDPNEYSVSMKFFLNVLFLNNTTKEHRRHMVEVLRSVIRIRHSSYC